MIRLRSRLHGSSCSQTSPLPADGDAPEGLEEISLGQFWNDFIVPGRGTASIWVSASGPAEKETFDQFLTTLERKAVASGGDG